MILAGTASQKAVLASPGPGGEDPSATITAVSTGPSNTYALTIKDASDATQAIGTFWYAWVPGKDFLASDPSADTAPLGWTANITHGGSTDGYAIQWVASSSAYYIPAGGSLSGFGFTTADSPSVVSANSVDYPTFATDTSFAYATGPFGDAGTEFVVSAVPEPASVGIALLSTALLLRRRRRMA
jgi:hypothetical protein